MSVISRVARFVRTSFYNVVFVPSVAVALFSAAPPYLFAWFAWRGASTFFPRWVYQVGDDFLYSIYQNYVLFFFEFVTGVKVLFDGDFEEIFSRKENAIYLGNHQSTVDWVLSNMVAVRQGSLGNLRYVMKSSLQHIPMYGVYFYEHGCIYVNRGNFDPQKMISGLRYLRHPRINTWMVVFPEGTRFGMARKFSSSSRRHLLPDGDTTGNGNMDSKLAGSGEPTTPTTPTPRVELKHHLLPKSRGTWLALTTLREQTKAVYSVSVVYDGCVDEDGRRKLAPQIFSFMRRECRWIYIHLKRIPIEDVPEKESEFQAWLDRLFVEKDKIVEDFYSPDPKVRKAAVARGVESKGCLGSAAFGAAVMSAVSIPFFLTDVGRSLYWKMAFLGSLIGYSRLALAAVD